MDYFLQEQISANQAVTPHGFLLCTAVPIARTGAQLYMPGETPVADGPEGYVSIERNADEVFSPPSLASYNGAPIVDEHPLDDVIPNNWRALAGGVVLNARRGDGDLSECVVADLMVTAPELITAIQSGKREVSVGYTCDYDQFEPGRGRQRNIVVNHLALVDNGRCGERCSIRDKQPEIPAMTVKTADKGTSNIVKGLLDRIRKSVKTKDEAGVEKSLTALEEITDTASMNAEVSATGGNGPGGPGEQHIHLHVGDQFEKKDDEKEKKDDDKEDEKKKDDKDTKDDEPNPNEERFARLEASVAAIAEAVAKITKAEQAEAAAMEEGVVEQVKQEVDPSVRDSVSKSTKDSALLSASFTETVAMAEILAPGIEAPKFDPSLGPKKTFDSICGHRRAALKVAATKDGTAGMIAMTLGGRTIDAISCDETRMLFRTAASLRASLNNGSTKDAVTLPNKGVKLKGPIKNIADFNKRNRELYG